MENDKSGATIGGIVFTGCLFIGGGIGMIFNEVKVGGAIGMGTGFLAMAAIWAYYKKSSKSDTNN